MEGLHARIEELCKQPDDDLGALEMLLALNVCPVDLGRSCTSLFPSFPYPLTNKITHTNCSPRGCDECSSLGYAVREC